VLDPWLGIFCLLSIALLTGLAVVGEIVTGPLQRNSNAKQISLQRWCEAAIEQAEAIVALGMRGAVLQWYGTECVPARQAADTAAGRLEVVIALSRTFRQITQVAIIGFSAWLAIESSLTAGGVIASSILLGRALAPFDQLIAGWRQLVAARDARRRLSELLKQSDKHIERSSLPPPSGELSVQRLTLRSPAGNNRWLLQDVSFRAQPGRGVGIIGPSGAGKTTLCRAAAGLVAPDIGEIRLDGARLDMWESDELGRYLGYLQQDVGLPPATVAQTIARLQRNADPELIHAAARAAGAHELILELPSGYDTPVGTGGVPISGGQRQRIGLARALYGNPVLIILDEPDAHLDHAGEEALRSAIINAKQRGAAVVLVAQRPAMIALMDDVVVLQNGKVTQFGPRVEVLRTAMRKEQSP
jgi:PrtD family type I secretion system ABC transporter